jgi:hypothetical protein
MSEPGMTVEEAAQRLIAAFLVEFADRDDDDLIPLRMFIVEVGEACGVQTDALEVPEWCSVGDLRANARRAFEGLARGERIP